VLDRPSIPLARFLFAITDAKTFIGQRVTVEGWYRRGLKPYVESMCIQTNFGLIHRTHSYWIQYAGAIVTVLAGGLWLMMKT
jgi:hypothetical protein